MKTHYTSKWNKYKNTKTNIDGIVFDSKLEARRYCELKLLERAGEIKNLQLQPPFELQPTFKKNGKTYRKIIYKADFSYIDIKTGATIVEDTKGMKTELYKLKKKLFEYKFPEITIKEITK